MFELTAGTFNELREVEDKAIADVNLKPTEAMRNAAKRGLEWRKEHGRGGTAIGVARARDISNGQSMSPSTVRRMHSFFSRHRVDLDAPAAQSGHEDYPSAGIIAWNLWGGNAGARWAERKVAELERETEKGIKAFAELQTKGIELAAPENVQTAIDLTDYENSLSKLYLNLRRALRTQMINMLLQAAASGVFDKKKSKRQRLQNFIDQATGQQLLNALQEAVRSPMADAASIGLRVGADDLLESVGVDLSELNPRTQRALERRIERMAEDLVREVADQTRDALNDMAERAGQEPDVFRELVEEYLETDEGEGVDARARRHARTQTAKVFNEGTMATLESGGVEMKQWNVNADACQYCRAVAAERKSVPINEVFYAKGHRLKGLDGGTMNLDYRAIDTPPLHPNCRCWISAGE